MADRITRRQTLAGTAAMGAMLVLPSGTRAGGAVPTPAVETSAGKLRGTRANGVSTFLGIPYGGDTGKHRFQPARVPEPWTGVRDCIRFGSRAPQASMGMGGAGGMSNPDYLRFLGGLFGAGGLQDGVESEDCLVLNLFTPDASPSRKRPVMVWLHGGGFAQGSGAGAMYDGTALCNRGDVVVVTINHRLNAMGYLYLGALHPDFADSGNVGQLDIVLALQWVRENIASFGGDPGNVTIFGESGGGAKVGTLLGMPPAQGLFHKAIQQSGPVLNMVPKEFAAAHAERTLAALGIAGPDVHQLQTIEFKKVIGAAMAAASSGPAGRARGLAPVVDGRSLPAHPFDPAATAISREIPLIIGFNKDEPTLFMAADPKFGKFTEAEARERFAAAGPKAAATFETYKKLRPQDPPTYWLSAMTNDSGTGGNSIKQAERKAALGAGPVYLYRLDWETPVLNGMLRAPHGLDTPLVFDNAATSPALVGPGDAPGKIAADMSQAWVNFARSGNPSRKGLQWPRYEADKRQTMLFDVPSHVVSDPDRERRLLWA